MFHFQSLLSMASAFNEISQPRLETVPIFFVLCQVHDLVLPWIEPADRGKRTSNSKSLERLSK